MAKDAFEGIMEGLGEALAIAEGRAAPARLHVPASVDVAGIRQKMQLSQAAFATRYGFSVGAVRDWEQGRRLPEASARVLLTVIDREPEAVSRALEATA